MMGNDTFISYLGCSDLARPTLDCYDDIPGADTNLVIGASPEDDLTRAISLASLSTSQ